MKPERANLLAEATGAWRMVKEGGVEYSKKIRKGWVKRRKSLRL